MVRQVNFAIEDEYFNLAKKTGMKWHNLVLLGLSANKLKVEIEALREQNLRLAEKVQVLAKRNYELENPQAEKTEGAL